MNRPEPRPRRRLLLAPAARPLPAQGVTLEVVLARLHQYLGDYAELLPATVAVERSLLTTFLFGLSGSWRRGVPQLCARLRCRMCHHAAAHGLIRRQVDCSGCRRLLTRSVASNVRSM